MIKMLLCSTFIFIIFLQSIIANEHLEKKFILDIVNIMPECNSVVLLNNWNIQQKVAFKRAISNRIAIDFKWNVPLLQSQPHRLMIVIDLRNAFGINLLKLIAHNKQYFRHPHRWLLLINNTISTLDGIDDIYMLPDSNLIFGIQRNDESFILQQVYKINETEEMIYEHFGIWNYTCGLTDERTTTILSRRRRNLRQKQFRTPIVLAKNVSFTDYDDLSTKQFDPLSKVTGILITSMMMALNSTLEFIPFSTWGYLDQTTGKYDGMFGDLLYGDGEIGGTPSFMIPYRLLIVDYLSLMTPTRTYFIFRAPPLSYVSNIYYLPFNRDVWITSISITILSFSILYLTYRIIQNKHPKNPGDSASGGEIALITVGAVCQTGYTKEPRNISGRISMFTLLLSALFTYTSYSANIVALLQSTTKSIRTVEDLLKYKIELGVENTTYARFYFPRQTDPIKKQVYEKKIASKNTEYAGFYNITHGIERLQKEFFAFHIEAGPGYTEIENKFYEHEKCDLIEISYLDVVDPWFLVKKHSPFKEILKTNAFKLREHGIAKRENLRYYTQKPKCTAKGFYFHSVRLEDCYAAFLVLIYGFCISFIIYILESIMYKINQNKQKNTFDKICKSTDETQDNPSH